MADSIQDGRGLIVRAFPIDGIYEYAKITVNGEPFYFPNRFGFTIGNMLAELTAEEFADLQELRKPDDEPLPTTKLPWEKARDAVLEIHPKAYCGYNQSGRLPWVVCEYFPGMLSKTLGRGQSEHHAWIDAASKLPKPQDPRPPWLAAKEAVLAKHPDARCDHIRGHYQIGRPYHDWLVWMGQAATVADAWIDAAANLEPSPPQFYSIPITTVVIDSNGRISREDRT